MAFKLACQYAFREAFGRAKPVILEPVMDVDVRAPAEFQGTIIGDLNRRKGVILNSEGELDDVVMKAQVIMSAAVSVHSFPIRIAAFMMWHVYRWSGQQTCLAPTNKHTSLDIDTRPRSPKQETLFRRPRCDLSVRAGAAERHVWVQHGLTIHDTGQGRVHDGVCAPHACYIRQASRADGHLQERSCSSMMPCWGPCC